MSENDSEEEIDELEWEEWNPAKISFHHHMIAGSCAGLAEHVSIFPIDTLKTHVQCERCGSISPLQTWNCATRIVKKEGIFRLWRGVSAMFAGCVPAHAAYFSIFESIKHSLGADKKGHHPIQAAAAGVSASLAHDFCMTPFDTVKQRMQLGYYKNIFHCVKSIFRQEGLRAFYVSFSTTIMMNIPFACVMVSVNESARKILNPSEEFSLSASMMAGCFAGACAAAVTNPLDVIKTKLQTQNLEPCPRITSKAPDLNISFHSINSVRVDITRASENIIEKKLDLKGSLDAVRLIISTEGYKGFLRGTLPRVLVHAPAVAITWTTYESMKTILTEGVEGFSSRFGT